MTFYFFLSSAKLLNYFGQYLSLGSVTMESTPLFLLFLNIRIKHLITEDFVILWSSNLESRMIVVSKNNNPRYELQIGDTKISRKCSSWICTLQVLFWYNTLATLSNLASIIIMTPKKLTLYFYFNVEVVYIIHNLFFHVCQFFPLVTSAQTFCCQVWLEAK